MKFSYLVGAALALALAFPAAAQETRKGIRGVVSAIDDRCSHAGGPLSRGAIRDGVVTCPWHWYSYELATGRCRTAAGYSLRRYPVVMVDGRPHAALPAAAPARSWSQILRSHARQGGTPA